MRPKLSRFGSARSAFVLFSGLGGGSDPGGTLPEKTFIVPQEQFDDEFHGQYFEISSALGRICVVQNNGEVPPVEGIHDGHGAIDSGNVAALYPGFDEYVIMQGHPGAMTAYECVAMLHSAINAASVRLTAEWALSTGEAAAEVTAEAVMITDDANGPREDADNTAGFWASGNLQVFQQGE